MQDEEARKRWLEMLADLGLPLDSEPPTAPEPVEPSAATEAPAEVIWDDVPAPALETPPSRGRRRKAQPPSEPTTEASEAPAPTEASTETPVAETPVEEPSGRNRRRRRKAREEEPVTAETQTEGELPTSEEPAAEESVELVAEVIMPPLQDEALVEAPAEVEEEASEDDSPAAEGGRRRRRRRRGRRAEAEQAATAPVLVQEDEDEPDEEEAVEEEVVASSEEPEDDEEYEDLTNLSVPTWAELVAGLYRPPDR